MNAQSFIQLLGPQARDNNRLTGIPASVTLAQAALESSWGDSELAQRGKNLFGIKADPAWQGATMTLPTVEYVNGQRVTTQAQWRVYIDWGGSMNDHARFFYTNPRYREALAVRDNPLAFAQQIVTCGYCTDPDYVSKIKSIILSYSLDGWDVAPADWTLIDWAQGYFNAAQEG